VKRSFSKVTLPLEFPFQITGYTFENLNAVWVELEHYGRRGRGEGVGSYYLGETQESMLAQLNSLSEAAWGLGHEELIAQLPPGGAKNALDCALWDLRCKSEGKTIWELLEITPRQLNTVATVGIGSDEFMASRAKTFANYPSLKIKLDHERPLERVGLIRDARPDATLVLDANQAWDRDQLEGLLPGLQDLGVAMIEQPVKRGEDSQLAGLESPIPLGADESCLTLDEYGPIKDLYDVINIKLDKCGGLTPALELAKVALRDGKKLMVGNMTGSSLSMAPAFVIGQFCEYVDIDGPLLLADDIANPLEYLPGGLVNPPKPELWG
jgi:L-alanine-DL-glutamate epimerase-like enolase superfamily enzyme